MATDTNINNLIINKLTLSQYEALIVGGQINQNELYMITDDDAGLSAKEDIINKVTSISSTSTNLQYPSAKAVYDYIQSLDGNGVTY